MHNTCFLAMCQGEKAFLYMIILKNLEMGKGVPTAFMLTLSKSQ